LYDDFIHNNYNVSETIKKELESFIKIRDQVINSRYNLNLKKIYEEFGEDICLFPFFGIFYSLESSNQIRPCSVFSDQTQIDNSNLIESRNTVFWKELRKKFINQSCHNIPECSVCSRAEKTKTHSIRLLNNQYYAEHLDINFIKEIQDIINNNYISNRILSLDYMPSSYCNYECVMCLPGASSRRHAFENKYKNKIINIKSEQPTEDFYQNFEEIQILNLTGGETLLQPKVHEIIKYLVDKNLSKNISISLLTNASTYPTKVLKLFKKFKKVFYTVSIDGIGEVIEYQRRGAEWKIVKQNADKLIKNFGAVINCVVTAINVFQIDELFEYFYNMKYDKIYVSLVFQDFLSPSVIPNELKNQLMDKLINKRNLLDYNNQFDFLYIDLYDRVIETLKIDRSDLLEKFIQHIHYEDLASKKKLIEIIPEWKPYFE